MSLESLFQALPLVEKQQFDRWRFERFFSSNSRIRSFRRQSNINIFQHYIMIFCLLLKYLDQKLRNTEDILKHIILCMFKESKWSILWRIYNIYKFYWRKSGTFHNNIKTIRTVLNIKSIFILTFELNRYCILNH